MELLCALCEQAPATTEYGMPVCPACQETLVDLDVELAAMESDDPSLAEAGRKVREAEQEWLRKHPK